MAYFFTQALDSAGQKEMALSVFKEAVRHGIVRPWKFTSDNRGTSIRAMDLHQFSSALSRSAIRSHLEGVLAGSDTPKHDLVVIVGKGLNSINEPILGTAVNQLLQEEYDIVASIDPLNSGRLIVSKDALAKIFQSQKWS